MKAYVKPELRFESFVLSQTVALCDLQLVNNGDVNTCKCGTDRFLGDAVGAFANTDACDFETDLYCYTNGSSGLPKIYCS